MKARHHTPWGRCRCTPRLVWNGDVWCWEHRIRGGWAYLPALVPAVRPTRPLELTR